MRKKIGIFPVVEKFHMDGVFYRSHVENKIVYEDEHGSPFVHDWIYGDRVYLMGDDPYWFRTDGYNPKRNPNVERKFPGLEFRGARHPDVLVRS
jgi:hypothetical protein